VVRKVLAVPMYYLFLLLVVACVIGGFRPFIEGTKRIHYVAVGAISFVLLFFPVPLRPHPQRLQKHPLPMSSQ